MKKGIIAAVIVIIVVVLAIVLGTQKDSGNKAATTGTSGSSNSMDMDNMPTPSTSSSENTPAEATDSVTIENYAYTPATITVKKGTKVTWTNQDTVRHDVMADAGQTGPSSELLAKGASYSYTFDTVGKFTYHCTPHPYMKGTVIVTE